MKLYLVRHGESTARAEGRRQSPDTPLSAKGIKQAKLIANRLKALNFDVIFSSNWVRARETAEIISSRLGQPLEFFETLHEKEHNPQLYEVEINSRLQHSYTKELDQFLFDIDWRFKGKGESVRDVVERDFTFEKHILDNHLDQTILAVTHGNFMRSLVGAFVLGKDFDPTGFMKLYHSLTFTNTGLTMMEYNEEAKKWKIRLLNEHVHLEKIK